MTIHASMRWTHIYTLYNSLERFVIWRVSTFTVYDYEARNRLRIYTDRIVHFLIYALYERSFTLSFTSNTIVSFFFLFPPQVQTEWVTDDPDSFGVVKNYIEYIYVYVYRIIIQIVRE